MTHKKQLPNEIKLEDAVKVGFQPLSTDPPLYGLIYGAVEFVYRLDDRNVLCYFDRIPLKKVRK